MHQTTFDEVEAATNIAAALREQVAGLPIHSPLRSLALQSAGCWSTIAGQQQARLQAVAELRDQDSASSPVSLEQRLPDEAPRSPGLSLVR